MHRLSGVSVEGETYTETDERPAEPRTDLRMDGTESPSPGRREDLPLTLRRELLQ